MVTTFFRALVRRADYRVDEGGVFLDYSKYRTEIAEDCQFRCVYCDSHEDVVGGREAMEMDHFRPWRKKFGPEGTRKFEHLRNEPKNLVHACGVCNGFKWSHWPTENPDLCYDHEKGWINPFDEVRSNFFEVGRDGVINARIPPAHYHINKLRLNRPLLKRQREFHILIDDFELREQAWKVIIEEQPGTESARVAGEALQLLQLIRALISKF